MRESGLLPARVLQAGALAGTTLADAVTAALAFALAARLLAAALALGEPAFGRPAEFPFDSTHISVSWLCREPRFSPLRHPGKPTVGFGYG